MTTITLPVSAVSTYDLPTGFSKSIKKSIMIFKFTDGKFKAKFSNDSYNYAFKLFLGACGSITKDGMPVELVGFHECVNDNNSPLFINDCKAFVATMSNPEQLSPASFNGSRLFNEEVEKAVSNKVEPESLVDKLKAQIRAEMEAEQEAKDKDYDEKAAKGGKTLSTARQIGKMLSPIVSSQDVNALLELTGYQVSCGKAEWRATAKGITSGSISDITIGNTRTTRIASSPVILQELQKALIELTKEGA